MYEQKYTKQNWIWPVEPSCAKISDPSEMPRFDGKLIFFVISGSQSEMCALVDIVLTRQKFCSYTSIYCLIIESLLSQTRFTLVIHVWLTKISILSSKN